MTLEELEATLPNGLHDAYLERVVIDYAQGRACLDLRVSVGSPEDRNESPELYRPATIELFGLRFLAIDPPGPGAQPPGPRRVWIDAGPGRPPTSDRTVPSPLPEGVFLHWIFIRDWNSFFYVAATEAKLKWRDDPM